MKLASNAIRGLIIAPPGRKLVAADLSNIEGRALAHLAGETWKVEAFRDYDAGQGPDLYKLAYAKSFGIPVEEVTKDQRQVGKVEELAFGYGGGVGACVTFATAYGLDLNRLAETVPVHYKARASLARAKRERREAWGLADETWLACESLKRMWRDAQPATVLLWGELESAVRYAITNPGQPFCVRDLIVRRDGAWLRIKLPSGRCLCYPSPKIEEDGRISYMGIDQYTRKWQRIYTFGGKLVENVVQAFARDVLVSSMQRIEDAGYDIVLTVHDEILTEAPEFHPLLGADHLARLMTIVPDWAKGLPLAAAGFEAYRYGKE
jgi:DNA polymerase